MRLAEYSDDNELLGLEPHHIKYKEIDGIDEIIPLTRSEHKRKTWESRRQIKDGLKNKIPIQVIRNAKFRLLRKIEFETTIGKNVKFAERIDYNPYSGTIRYSSRFRGSNGYKIKVVV